jgi:hypothetical protein
LNTSSTSRSTDPCCIYYPDLSRDMPTVKYKTNPPLVFLSASMIP